MALPKRGLGKGLDALFIDNQTNDTAIRSLSINDIEPNPAQPRREFSQEKLMELAESIGEHGIISPLVVRPRPSGRYQIVAGERRWRASRIAGLTELPVIIKELTDSEAFEIALVENLVRDDLNPIEEAFGYKTLAEQFNMTQEMIAHRVGRSRPAVANALRLLALPQDILELLKNNDISAGHARALLALSEPLALELSRDIVDKELSVRQTEQLIKSMLQEKKPVKLHKITPTYYKEVEVALKNTLSRKVKVNHKGNDHGQLIIDFYSKDELGSLAKLLGKETN